MGRIRLSARYVPAVLRRFSLTRDFHEFFDSLFLLGKSKKTVSVHLYFPYGVGYHVNVYAFFFFYSSILKNGKNIVYTVLVQNTSL